MGTLREKIIDIIEEHVEVREAGTDDDYYCYKVGEAEAADAILDLIRTLGGPDIAALLDDDNEVAD